MENIKVCARSYYHSKNTRMICHLVKSGSTFEREKGISLIANDVISRGIINSEDILIPSPQHNGFSIYTKKIAKIISNQTSAKVCDILKCIPHTSLYNQKKLGKEPEIELYIDGRLLKGRRYFFLDNVISTGKTYIEARKILQINLLPLVYAVDDTKTNELAANGLIPYIINIGEGKYE